MFSSSQNGREPSRKPTDKKSLQIDEMLKEVLNMIPEAPLDGIGATPRNNDMGKKFNLADMHQPSRFKVRHWPNDSWHVRVTQTFSST